MSLSLKHKMGDIEEQTGELSRMYCAQCEQTLQSTGCISAGVCSKAPETSSIHDAIIYGATLLGSFQHKEDHVLIIQSLFSTLTNVNFNNTDLKERFLGPVVARLEAVAKNGPENATWFITLAKKILKEPKDSWTNEARAKLAPDVYIRKYGQTSAGIRYLTLLGMKGLCAYADHALNLLKLCKDPLTEIHAPMKDATRCLHTALFDPNLSVEQALDQALGIGKANLAVTELLDRLHAETLGVPTLCSVPTLMHPGKCVLITGHDLVDMFLLLTECQKHGINVYTHGEMFSAYTYPKLREFSCFKGHFGTAWQNQCNEMPHFPGPCIFTSNCIKPPLPSYKDRVFVMNCVGFDGIKAINNDDFSAVIASAKANTGFTDEEHCRRVEKIITKTGLEAENFHADEIRGAGFNHRVFEQKEILSKVVDLVKAGHITRIQFNGGCDGASKDRSTYSKHALQADNKTLILTNSCGRFRLNRLQDYGDIDGIPRLLDTGQCNDFYSLARIVMKLAETLKCGINDLPLRLCVSWFEQKAIVQFLTFLYLGVKNIQLGPTLPIFLSDETLGILGDKFGVTKIPAL